MRQTLRVLFLMITSSLTLTSLSWGDECQDAIDRAHQDVTNARNTQSQTMSQSSPELYSEDPAQRAAQQMQQMMQQINEGERRLLEVTRKEMEQYHQLDSEQFKQMEQLRDLERENAKQREALTAEKNNAAFELKKSQNEIRVNCESKAEQQYNEMITARRGEVTGSRFAVNSLGNARGTRSRMLAQRRVFYDRCIADPTTQASFEMAQEAYQLAMRNMQLRSDSLVADLEHIRSKYLKLDDHMTERRRHIAEMASLERAAVEQELQNMRTQMIFQSMQSASQAQNTQQAAVRFNGADQLLSQFDNIRSLCSTETGSTPALVPADFYAYFNAVNRSCRGGSTTNPCVRSTGQMSQRARGPTAQ